MLETEENITKQSSGIVARASCSSQAPWAFGHDDGLHPLRVERGERRVVDDHGEMENTAQRLIAEPMPPSSRVTSVAEPTSACTTCTSTPRARRLSTKACALPAWPRRCGW